MKRVAAILVGISLIFLMVVFSFAEIPFWNRPLHITNEGLGSYYFVTIGSVESEIEVGMTVTRENGKWTRTTFINVLRKDTAGALINMFKYHVKLAVDRAIPKDEFEQVTVGIFAESERIIIMLGPKYNQNKEVFEELLEDLNHNLAMKGKKQEV